MSNVIDVEKPADICPAVIMWLRRYADLLDRRPTVCAIPASHGVIVELQPCR